MSTLVLDELSHDLMLRAMITMAQADGELADVESATISAVYNKVTGDSIEEAEIEIAAKGILASGRALKEDLSAASSSMDKQVKESIVKAAYLVLIADGEVAAGERKKLFDIANALKMPEIQVSAILEDLDS